MDCCDCPLGRNHSSALVVRVPETHKISPEISNPSSIRRLKFWVWFKERVHSTAPGASPCARAAQRWVLAATILGSSMAFIDSTVVNVALPALQTELSAAVADVQWVIEAYSLLLSALLLVGGSLGDRYGRR